MMVGKGELIDYKIWNIIGEGNVQPFFFSFFFFWGWVLSSSIFIFKIRMGICSTMKVARDPNRYHIVILHMVPCGEKKKKKL
jgi:hypothetical protein